MAKQLDINSMHFPAEFVNVTNADHKLGGAWFSPQRPLPLNRAFVESNLSALQSAIDHGILELVGQETKGEEDSTANTVAAGDGTNTLTIDDGGNMTVEGEITNLEDGSDEDSDVDEGGDNVGLFELHWRSAVKKIEEIQDGQEVEKLLAQADEMGMEEDHAVYKALMKRMEELSE